MLGKLRALLVPVLGAPAADSGRKHRCSRRFVPDLEGLEDRLVPATFTVNTTLDLVNSSDGQLSLREAITRANAQVGADTIVLPAGVYRVTLAGAGDNTNV